MRCASSRSKQIVDRAQKLEAKRVEEEEKRVETKAKAQAEDNQTKNDFVDLFSKLNVGKLEPEEGTNLNKL
jgi:hypothetical protein